MTERETSRADEFKQKWETGLEAVVAGRDIKSGEGSPERNRALNTIRGRLAEAPQDLRLPDSVTQEQIDQQWAPYTEMVRSDAEGNLRGNYKAVVYEAPEENFDVQRIASYLPVEGADKKIVEAHMRLNALMRAKKAVAEEGDENSRELLEREATRLYIETETSQLEAKLKEKHADAGDKTIKHFADAVRIGYQLYGINREKTAEYLGKVIPDAEERFKGAFGSEGDRIEYGRQALAGTVKNLLDEDKVDIAGNMLYSTLRVREE